MPSWRVLTAAIVLVGAVGITVELIRDDPRPPGPCDVAQVFTLPSLSREAAVPVAFEHIVEIKATVALTEASPGRLLVVAKPGTLWDVTAGRAALILDLRDEMATRSEQGLLGVAVSDEGNSVYLYGTWTDGTARVLEYALTPAGVDLSTRRTILTFAVPGRHHNGGRLTFGPDGALYLGVGDGLDLGHLVGASQDPGSPLGKILRIDVETGAYEPWASGLRNPWGWSFDRETGEAWIGDVGANCYEEIDRVSEGGANFGWPYTEGAHALPSSVFGDVDPPANVTPPIRTYRHRDGGCGVIGGYVYRGEDVPDLRGRFVWSDLCERLVHTLRPNDGHYLESTLGEAPDGIVAFAEGRDGELYVLSISDGVFRLVPG